jgi:hypothetical protein
MKKSNFYSKMVSQTQKSASNCSSEQRVTFLKFWEINSSTYLFKLTRRSINYSSTYLFKLTRRSINYRKINYFTLNFQPLNHLSINRFLSTLKPINHNFSLIIYNLNSVNRNYCNLFMPTLRSIRRSKINRPKFPLKFKQIYVLMQQKRSYLVLKIKICCSILTGTIVFLLMAKSGLSKSGLSESKTSFKQPKHC